MAQPLRSTPITGASPLLRAGPPAHRSNPVRLPKFHARAADQAHAASMPDTARPVIGTPAEPSSRGPEHGHGFDAPSNVTTRRQRFGFTHLPGPHLTHPVRLFHIAHHDGLQSGGRRESHPPAPTDPYVNLSIHTALVILITRRRGRRWSRPSARRTAGTPRRPAATPAGHRVVPGTGGISCRPNTSGRR
jgi:hypothetical protein